MLLSNSCVYTLNIYILYLSNYVIKIAASTYAHLYHVFMRCVNNYYWLLIYEV